MSLHAYKLGVENIPMHVTSLLRKSRVGIITNQTGVDQKGMRTIDILRKKRAKLCAIFVPEHGLEGKIMAEKDVANSIDAASGLPVISLYKGCTGHITNHTFDNIDVLVFDMQDVGMRHYTYVSTLYTIMDAAAKANKKVVVFDRPNPLGSIMEGPLCDTSFRSFVGIANFPLRHGMTVGELAQFFNKRCLKKSVDLKVVPLEKYDRTIKVAKLHKHLSPNIQTMPSVYGYSFLGLLGEIRPFNVGVGTPQSFQVIMLPKDLKIAERAWDQMRFDLQKFGIRSKRYQYFCDKKAQDFDGLLLQFEDIHKVSGFKALLTVLSWAKNQQLSINFSQLFDKAIGTNQIQTWYKKGACKKQLIREVKQSLQDFLRTNKDVLLYQSHPKVVQLQQGITDCLTV